MVNYRDIKKGFWGSVRGEISHNELLLRVISDIFNMESHTQFWTTVLNNYLQNPLQVSYVEFSPGKNACRLVLNC